MQEIDQQFKDHFKAVLVRPQMGENIGASARALLNCGFENLDLINPRDGWPDPKAEAMGSGAWQKMPPPGIFNAVKDSIQGCRHVYATTARSRDIQKNVLTGREAAEDIAERLSGGQKIAVLFGAERTGLTNDETALAHSLITIPLNQEFSSLNLAQSVLLIAYDIRMALLTRREEPLSQNAIIPAPYQDIDLLLSRLEEELEKAGFFRSKDLKPKTIHNLKSMILRAEMTEQEIRTFHGIISALISKKAQ